jgi:DNA-binding PadR family transcriptional regulator
MSAAKKNASYEILGLVGRQGAGPHDLLRLAKRGRFLNWAGESQYYTEPKRLARLGYLSARKEPGKTRERTVYTLTDKGLDALREWATTPVTFTPLKSEPLLRLLVCDLVGEEVTRESINTLRDDVADLQKRVDEAEAAAHELPHREKYLLPTTGFMRRYLELHLELIDTVERDMAPGQASPPERKSPATGQPAAAAQNDPHMASLATVGADDRLDALKPSPTGLERKAADRCVADPDQIRPASSRARAGLVR